MRKTTTYRLSIGTMSFSSDGEARKFLAETGLSGAVKRKNGSYRLKISPFRTKIRKEAVAMQKQVLEYPLSSPKIVEPKIVEEHDNHRKIGGARQ